MVMTPTGPQASDGPGVVLIKTLLFISGNTRTVFLPRPMQADPGRRECWWLIRINSQYITKWLCLIDLLMAYYLPIEIKYYHSPVYFTRQHLHVIFINKFPR
jgi:hypothetical protein